MSSPHLPSSTSPPCFSVSPPEKQVPGRVDKQLHVIVALDHLELVLLGQERIQVLRYVGVCVQDGIPDTLNTQHCIDIKLDATLTFLY